MINNNSFQKDYDVVVVGLGTAGALALINAAKLGLKVLGIERLNGMGGTGTLGGIGGYYFGSSGGMFEGINEQVFKMQQNYYAICNYPKFDVKSYILEQTAVAYGAEIMYESVVTDAFLDGTTVVGVKCFFSGKSINISSKFVIDCTGEADICNMCGCETRTGRQYDGQTQPFTNVVIAAENDTIWGINRDSGYVNQNDIEDLSKSIINSLTLQSGLQDDYSQSLEFLTNASLLGIREGRTIVGEEIVTLNGFFDGNSTKEPLFYAYSNIDNHGKDTVFEDEIIKDWYVCAGLWGVIFSIGVPLGALIPKGYYGILTAGRCISVEHNIAPCIRMKSDMEKCGEAAAAIAFLAIKNKTKAKDVEYKKLSEMLKSSGCLDEANNVGHANRTKNGVMPFNWINNISEIENALSSDSPGIAIWSAKLIGEEIIESLTKWVKSDNTNLRKHSAIALGLLGDKNSLPILRDIAVQRDITIPNSGAKYIYTLCTSAVYLLGKLGDIESLDILFDIVKSKGAFDETKFTSDEFHETPNDIRFQIFSYAALALVDIRKSKPQSRELIEDFLKTNVLNINTKLEITLKTNIHNKYDMYPKIKNYILENMQP